MVWGVHFGIIRVECSRQRGAKAIVVAGICMELEENQAGSEHSCINDHAGSRHVELDNFKSICKYLEILDKIWQRPF